MLQRWLDKRRRWTTLGACAAVVVEARRSIHGLPLLAMNVDDDRVQFGERPSGDDAWLESSHVFVGRNEVGLIVACIVRRPATSSSTRRLGRGLLEECPNLARVGESLRSLRRQAATILAADGDEVVVWRVERGTTCRLPPTDGLLTLAAGHSSARPSPGRGWLIDRLERLHRLRRVSEEDVASALRDARLGDSTACSIVVDPANGQARIDTIERSAFELRKSA
jgi:hypothetical protein